jgi:hypothetical protein
LRSKTSLNRYSVKTLGYCHILNEIPEALRSIDSEELVIELTRDFRVTSLVYSSLIAHHSSRAYARECTSGVAIRLFPRFHGSVAHERGIGFQPMKR